MFGRDSFCKDVMSGINPQGIDVVSFKQPNSEELAHDFLWRINRRLFAVVNNRLFVRTYSYDYVFSVK